jgi:hypothetical protein
MVCRYELGPQDNEHLGNATAAFLSLLGVALATDTSATEPQYGFLDPE